MEVEIGRIPKKSREDIEIIVRAMDDQFGEAIDVREWIDSDRYTGWSRKGIRIPLWMAETVAQAIFDAYNDFGGPNLDE